MTMQPRVGVIVLNWNNTEDTLECLASVLESTYRGIIVWLVDNASDDDPTHVVAEKFPQVHVARQATNLGYAGGNNEGIRLALAAGVDYVLILNNDVVVAPDMIAHLVRVAQAHPDAGFITPTILVAGGGDRIYWDGGTIDWSSGDVHHDSSRLPTVDGVTESEWSNGCAPLVRAGTIRDIGLMDERLFLYYEDVDWSARATARGWRHIVVARARCWHKVSASTGGISAPRSRFYFARNRYLVLQRHNPAYASYRGVLRYAVRLVGDYGWWRTDAITRRMLVEASLALIRGRWGRYRPERPIVTTIAEYGLYGLSVAARLARRLKRRS